MESGEKKRDQGSVGVVRKAREGNDGVNMIKMYSIYGNVIMKCVMHN